MMNWMKTHKKQCVIAAIVLFVSLIGTGTVIGAKTWQGDKNITTEEDKKTAKQEVAGLNEQASDEIKPDSKKATPSEEVEEQTSVENAEPVASEKKSSAKKEVSSNKVAATSTNTTKKDNETKHTHKYEKKVSTVQHEATGHYENVCVKEAWTEEVPYYEDIAYEACNECGEDLTTGYTLEEGNKNITEHTYAHAIKHEKAGHHTVYDTIIKYKKVNHPAEYEQKWVVDKEAWKEEVVTYQCSGCGATK